MRPVPEGAAAHILVSLDRLAAPCADLAVRVSRVIVYGQPRLPEEMSVFEVQAHRVR
jgi:hypothetical protein